MPFVDYMMLDPRSNWTLLNSGEGAVPLINTAAAYEGVRSALDSSASSADGSLAEMDAVWPGGLGSERAQSAFRKHNEWVRVQSSAAGVLAQIADAGAQLHATVVGLMPSILQITLAEANLIEAIGEFVSTVNTPASLITGPRLATAVGLYMEVWGQAAYSMATYEAGAVQVVSALATVPIVPPPPIAVPTGGGFSPTLDTSGPLTDLAENGPNSQLLSDHPVQSTADGTQSTGDGTQSTGDGTQSAGDGTQSTGDGGGSDSVTDPTQSQTLPDQSPSTIESVRDGSLGSDGASSYSDSMLGNPQSPTLAGLSGGVGSAVALGMMRGGIGSMPGAATGFRMPGSWTPGTGTPFGATTGAPSGAPVRNAPNRVSAPTARMRRRRKEEEERTGKVFTPGEQFEVPVLERPPAIGVIEYEDDTPEDELLADSSLVGVLDRLDDEVEPDNGESSR